MNDTSQIWMTVGRAAAAAGVASRTAFRWVEEGRLEVRPQGASRLIEVGALHALARGGVPPVAGASANSRGSIPAADLAATPDRIAAVEAGISALGGRLREVELRLGIASGAAGASGDRTEGEAP